MHSVFLWSGDDSLVDLIEVILKRIAFCSYSTSTIPASDDDAAAVVVVVVVANDVVRKNRQQLTHKHVGGWDRRYIPENRNTILDSSCV